MARSRPRERARQRALSRLASRVVLVVLFAAFVAPVARAEQRPKPQASPVVVEIRDHGFHWADAAVGAAGAIGVMCAAGAALLLRRAASG